jgi:predicted DNA binding CopG/RHH family protein
MSWLLVTEWNNTHDLKTRFDLVKRVEASGSKAKKLEYEYELELNKNIDYRIDENLIKAIKEKITRFSVCAIPYSQAREYRNFDNWECNKDF